MDEITELRLQVVDLEGRLRAALQGARDAAGSAALALTRLQRTLPVVDAAVAFVTSEVRDREGARAFVDAVADYVEWRDGQS